MTPRQAQQAATRLVQRLIDERRSRNLGVLTLADDAGLTRWVISDNEIGKTSPRLTTCIAWADALDLEIRLVWKGTPE